MNEKNDRILEILLDFVDKVENACLEVKHSVSKLKSIEPSIPEETFVILKWQNEKGSRLGNYECAYKNQNTPENWRHCFNILKQNSSVISNPFHLEGYQYRYWIYPEKYEDRIFRKKLNEA